MRSHSLQVNGNTIEVELFFWNNERFYDVHKAKFLKDEKLGI